MKNSGLSELFLPHKTQSRIWIQLNSCLPMFILDEVCLPFIRRSYILSSSRLSSSYIQHSEGLPCDMSWCNGLDTQSSAQSQCSRSWIRLACSAGGLWGKRDSSHPKDARKTADSMHAFSFHQHRKALSDPHPVPIPPGSASSGLLRSYLACCLLNCLSCCFLILHSFLKTWWKTVTRAQRYTCINIYVDELEGRYVHPVFPPLTLVIWSVFSAFFFFKKLDN